MARLWWMRRARRTTLETPTGERILRARIRVEGRVQGVYYRVHARDKADRLGVTGWVRNLTDGSVEIVAEGNEPAVRSLIEWCGRGSPRAVVTGVFVSWEPCTGEDDRFFVRD